MKPKMVIFGVVYVMMGLFFASMLMTVLRTRTKLHEQYPECMKYDATEQIIQFAASMVVFGLTKSLLTRLATSYIRNNLSKQHLEDFKGKPEKLDEFVFKLSSHIFKGTIYIGITYVYWKIFKDDAVMFAPFGGEHYASI